MKHKTTVLSLLLASGMLFSENVSAEDISPTHWSYQNFVYAKEKGFIKGDQYGHLNPDKMITRAEFATTIVNAMKLQMPNTVEQGTVKSFKDVYSNDWYYTSVSIATYYDLIKGDDYGNFKPNDLVTREEMAAMLYRAVQHLKYDSIKLPLTFPDNANISNWASESIQYILSNGLMSGRGDGTFGPKLSATRAEAVTVVRNLLEIDPENPIKVGVPKEEPKEPVVVGPTVKTIEYSSTFEAALTKQLRADPKADGKGTFSASKEAVEYYMHPGSFDSLHPYYYQFLKLSGVVTGISAEEINESLLKDAGVLAGTAATFIEVGTKLDINFIYLLAHAVHETNYGKSTLSKGIEVGRNALGNAERVTDENRETLTDIRVVYNMFGLGANDSAPDKLGSERAYNEGWFTVQDAIVGGATDIAKRYLTNGKDTLYEMKWNPTSPGSSQYATHIVWAVKQAEKIAEVYKKTGADKTTNAVFEIPRYVDQPAAPAVVPTMEAWYAVDVRNSGMTGIVTTNELRIRSYPGTGLELSKLQADTTVTVIGENNGWFKVTAENGLVGWVSGEYVQWDSSGAHLIGKSGYINVDKLNFRATPVDGSILAVLIRDTTFTVLEVIEGWYKVNVNGIEGWVASSLVGIN